MSETGARTVFIRRILFSFLVAVGVILIFSCCSPFYPFNYWEDPNCFFTMGAGILKGQLPYRDLYEQKGPLLYFIHALAALISKKTFIGVFFIQIIICTITHYFSVKIASLYVAASKRLYIISVPATMLLYSTRSYFYGDSAEEMILPFYVISLYIILKTVKTKSLPCKKETAFIAVSAACAFWIKYTLCGFFLGTVIIFLVFSIRHKQTKKLIPLIFVFLAAFVAASLPVLAYFALNNALGDLYTAYFYNNIFLYRNVNESVPLSGILPYTLTIAVLKLIDNPYLGITILISMIYFVAKKCFSELASYLTLFLFTIMFIFQGSFIGFYYVFALAALSMPAAAAVEDLFTKLKAKLFAAVPVCIGLAVASFFSSYATDNIFKEKSEMPQYAFADYLKDYPNATLLNYGFLDQGFYMVSGITPTEKYFCGLNIDSVLDEARISKEEAVADQRVDFIVTKNKMYEWKNYKLVKYGEYTTRDFNSQVGTDSFFLYQRIGA
ncbi:MAG: glycosyltransferase family 39 protein [Clostridiales bacterium]|nr:glycosyltransferase family 39 protein [Clostridiales bacterium]